MVKNGSKVGVRNFAGMNPMMNACECGNLEIAQFFIKKGCEIDMKDKNGRTSLMVAVAAKRRNVAKWLINNGADVKPKEDEKKKSALIYAAELGDKEMYDLLVQKGASQNAKDKSGKNAKDYLAEFEKANQKQ